MITMALVEAKRYQTVLKHYTETPPRIIFISQPMAGKSIEEITIERDRIADLFLNDFVLNTIFQPSQYKTPIEALALSILALAGADLVVMASGWWEARGCSFEHDIAKEYGIPILYSDLAFNEKEGNNCE